MTLNQLRKAAAAKQFIETEASTRGRTKKARLSDPN